jgi:hypothetical protein
MVQPHQTIHFHGEKTKVFQISSMLLLVMQFTLCSAPPKGQPWEQLSGLEMMADPDIPVVCLSLSLSPSLHIDSPNGMLCCQ